MSIDMQKIVNNFAQALESARKTRSKKLICDCGQALHWKKRAKELSEMVTRIVPKYQTDLHFTAQELIGRAKKILNEIESAES